MTVEVDIVEINADEDLMGQVWVNLLHNAIKFTPQGGSISVSLQVTVNRRLSALRTRDRASTNRISNAFLNGFIKQTSHGPELQEAAAWDCPLLIK